MTKTGKAKDGKELAGPPPKLTKEQYDLLLFLEQEYWRTGSLPSFDAITKKGISLAESSYYEAWTNPRFLDGLKSRGIPDHALKPEEEKGAFDGHILSEKQMMVANVLIDTLDKRSRLKKLTELGVSTNEYNKWLRDPVYRRYCLARAEELLLDNQATAHLSLIARVEQGDLGAIKYFNSMTGRYRERLAAGVEVNVTNNFGRETLIAVVEIIQRHVKDPEVLAAIGDDIMALTAGENNAPVGNPTPPVGYGNRFGTAIEGRLA